MSTTGNLTVFHIPDHGETPTSLAWGPDGDLWLTVQTAAEHLGEEIVRVPTSAMTPVSSATPAVVSGSATPTSSTAGACQPVTASSHPEGTEASERPVEMSIARIRGELARALDRLNLGRLLRRRTMAVTFHAPSAGVLSLSLLATSRGGHRAHRHSIVIARGSHVFAAAGSARVVVRLTPAGRRLPRSRRRIAITASARFGARAAAAISVTRVLRR